MEGIGVCTERRQKTTNSRRISSNWNHHQHARELHNANVLPSHGVLEQHMRHPIIMRTILKFPGSDEPRYGNRRLRSNPRHIQTARKHAIGNLILK